MVRNRKLYYLAGDRAVAAFLGKNRKWYKSAIQICIVHASREGCLQIIQSESIVCIAQEYAAGGDLLKKIKKQSRINEDRARFYFRQLIEALMVKFTYIYLTVHLFHDEILTIF